MGAPVTGVLKTRKGELDSNWCGCRIVNARCLETRVEIEGNGSDDSWEALELGCRKVQDRANHAMHTENLGHEADHQELGPGDGGNCSAGLHLFFFFSSIFPQLKRFRFFPFEKKALMVRKVR